MKISDFSHYAFGICAAVVMLGGCGGLQAPIGAPRTIPQSMATTTHVMPQRVEPAFLRRPPAPAYKVLYSFGDYSGDGEFPVAPLKRVRGTLYGTTGLESAYRGSGTVFSITTSGTEKVLHSFRKGRDGADPAAGMIDVSGTLYGTTVRGGDRRSACSSFPAGGLRCGTVFQITTSGVESVIHRFGKGTDGVNPYAGLIDVNGTLYGTTITGGAYAGRGHYGSIVGGGTVFSITPSGTEKVLHSFSNGSDGSGPVASLIDVNGTLYGTTSGGGAYAGSDGTVFSITPSGTEKVLHNFKGTDGADPSAALIDVNGTLYGTTFGGGAYAVNCGGGTVFSITPSGTEKVLHSFCKGTDGADPSAALIDVNGTLYGTTYSGGAYGNGSSSGGTVFSITPSGTEKVLHSFGKGTDGALPAAGLIDANGTLYGTTENGGKKGDGTVFALTP